MAPTVGCVVHYVSYGTPGGEYGQECRAAVIAEVPAEQKPDGTSVRLCVLNPGGIFFCHSHEDQTLKAGGTWHWPERMED